MLDMKRDKESAEEEEGRVSTQNESGSMHPSTFGALPNKAAIGLIEGQTLEAVREGGLVESDWRKWERK